VTAALKSQPSGSHTLGITLGNGWYNQPKVAKFTKAAPKLLLRLSITMADGTTMDVVSGAGAAAGAWQQHISPITMDDIYAGETYNATLETPDWTILGSDSDSDSDSGSVSDSGSDSGSGWAPVQEVPSPSANTTISSHAVLPPIRVGQTFSPCDMWQSSPGVYVFDFCQNMAGFATLHIPAGVAMEANVAIEMMHAEAIHGPPSDHSSIFNHYGSNDFEVNTYVTRGDGSAVEWNPSFCYAGFRYVQLRGHPGVPDYSTLTARFIHTANEDIGAITFSDEKLDAVQHITRASAKANFMHIPTDCPQ
jgi:alpha-L-rhamnosidase